MISIDPPSARAPPSFSGLRADDDEWRLDPQQYRAFTDTVAGIELTDDLSATDCYRIGNRLEAFVAERKRDGEWTESLTDQYPAVDSLAEITTLARFFRTCHDCCLDSPTQCR